MTTLDFLFQQVAAVQLPHFFITVEMMQEGKTWPTDIESFLRAKHQRIQQGATGRKFIYSQKGWRLIFTFFPTNEVVDERYALKNKTMFKHYL